MRDTDDQRRGLWSVTPSRRQFFRTTALAVTQMAVACVDGDAADDGAIPDAGHTIAPDADGVDLEPTPACDDEETSGDIEGPYYIPDAPMRRSLVVLGLPGMPLALSGRVVDRRCQPLSGWIVDVWHADHDGRYYGFDDIGTLPEPRFNYRGRVLVDEQGRYAIDTIVPGLYGARPRHIHVKVYPPETNDFQSAFTTQLYFPADAAVGSGLRNNLVLRLHDAGTAHFDFVMEVA